MPQAEQRPTIPPTAGWPAAVQLPFNRTYSHACSPEKAAKFVREVRMYVWEEEVDGR